MIQCKMVMATFVFSADNIQIREEEGVSSYIQTFVHVLMIGYSVNSTIAQTAAGGKRKRNLVV